MRIGIQLFYFLIVAVLMPQKAGAFEAWRVGLILSMVVFSVITEWVFFSKEKNFFRLDVLFVIGFCIVHFQWPLMILADVKMRHLKVEGFIEQMNYGTWLSALGVIAWIVGWGSFKFEKERLKKIVSIDYSKIKWAFYVLLGAFLVFAGKAYLTGAVYKGEADTAAAAGIGAYIQILLGCTITVLVAYHVPVAAALIKKKGGIWKNGDPLLIMGLAGCVLMFLVAGDRGGAISIMSSSILVFAMLVRKITFKEFVVLALAGAFVLTVIGLGRSSGARAGDENMLADGLRKLDEIEAQSSYVYTLELANSVSCVYASTEHVPKQRGFFYGGLWRSSLLAIVPMGQQLYSKIWDFDPKEMGSGEFITYLFYGEGSVVGAGSSIIADLYLNWGVLGIPVFMFGLGVVYKRVHKGVLNHEGILWVVAAASLAAIAFYSGRAGYLVFLRPFVWSLILAKALSTVKFAELKSLKAKVE